jgi:hypothetical protein
MVGNIFLGLLQVRPASDHLELNLCLAGQDLGCLHHVQHAVIGYKCPVVQHLARTIPRQDVGLRGEDPVICPGRYQPEPPCFRPVGLCEPGNILAGVQDQSVRQFQSQTLDEFQHSCRGFTLLIQPTLDRDQID